MAGEIVTTRKRILEPVERLSEILFGLIMALTFTGSFSVATAEHADVRELLFGAIGCNVAWGLIDGIMYLMGCLNDRGMLLRTLWNVRTATSREQAYAMIREEVPGLVASELQPDQLERIRTRIVDMPLRDARPRLLGDHVRGAIGVFLIVVASTLPVIVPFIFIQNVSLAMRLSNAIAVMMLAVIGYAYGRASSLPAWWTAAAMVTTGLLLVALTIALGG